MGELSAARWATPAVLVALVAISAVLRTRILDAGYWIDEGLSVGIANHGLFDIPGLLKEDGSPPLYYMLLHVWIGWFGDSEQATHALSLAAALLCIPAAYWAASTLFGRTTGWICAALAAVDPYLTAYGQETRMYSLLALLGIVATLAYVRGIIDGDRRWLALFVVALTAMLYTHNWSLFYAAALAIATLVVVRERWRELAVAAGATLVLFLPWLPTLLDQAQHTGAPWSRTPSLHALLLAPGGVLAGDAPLVAVVLGPVLLLCAAGVARAGRVGVIALVLVLVLWTNNSPRADKSDVREVSALVEPRLQPGDLVLSTHPEQTPALRHYLGPDYRYANMLGPMRDAQIFDWRDAVERLQAAQPKATLEPLVESVPVGDRVVVIAPIFRDYRSWRADWTKLVYRRSVQWERLIARDPRLRHVAHLQANEFALEKRFSKAVQADVYVRER
jgi:hypothetical protein